MLTKDNKEHNAVGQSLDSAGLIGNWAPVFSSTSINNAGNTEAMKEKLLKQQQQTQQNQQDYGTDSASSAPLPASSGCCLIL